MLQMAKSTSHLRKNSLIVVIAQSRLRMSLDFLYFFISFKEVAGIQWRTHYILRYEMKYNVYYMYEYQAIKICVTKIKYKEQENLLKNSILLEKQHIFFFWTKSLTENNH